LFGYRTAEVERELSRLEAELGSSGEALRGSEAEADRLKGETELLQKRVVASELDATELRAELAGARERADEEMRTLTVLATQLEELRLNARGQATRIRLQALREAAELSVQTSAASDPAQADSDRERIMDAIEGAIDRIESEWEADAPAAPASKGASSSNGGGSVRAARRRVSVDVGPFADFSQLVRFEDAANAIGGTGDISIKRFSEGRARIDVAVSEPVDLLRELEERCDIDFKVRSTKDDEIVLDVDPDLT